MHIVALGMNHKTAPVELREKISFSHLQARQALPLIQQQVGVPECLLLSTCNRTEVYAATPVDPAALPLERFLVEHRQVDQRELCRHLYRLQDQQAVEHLFRVATGIDSMMVGEYQVLGQIKEALELALEQGAAARLLTRLFQEAIRVGKRARTETGVGQGAFSVGGCAVELAKTIFGSLEGRRVLVLGAGKMSELTARHLASSGACSLLVANRTYARAEELAGALGGQAIHYDEMYPKLAEVDIVISSTAAPHHVIEREHVQAAMRARRNSPLFLIDIAVPRDIDPRVADLDSVYLYNIDDLALVVQQDAAARAREVAKVEVMIGQEVARFVHWQRSLGAVPTLSMLRGKLEAIRLSELERARPRLERLGEDDRRFVEGLTESIVNKILHQPTQQLRETAANGDGTAHLEAVRRLFQLDAEASLPGEQPAEPPAASEPAPEAQT